MITIKDIYHLADLARIKLEETEAEHITTEIDSILGYVGQIQGSGGDMRPEVPALHNVMRDDVVTNEKGQYTEALLHNAPLREGDYLKVKKIL
ncbi:MAG: aspartyl-tRNA(Asn)/glutamyl-tRNA(Gln) amidotransferase subunit [Patescibacteria group bacterium]|nr:aspartyl-tRNA(Asn)/glutamyl-tRNA(Gln) amidotransferase subunit [Patescibacteria group bacterium]